VVRLLAAIDGEKQTFVNLGRSCRLPSTTAPEEIMRLKKIVEPVDAIAVVHAGETVASAGYGGNGTPDQLFDALEKRFLETGTPSDLTLVFSTGAGRHEGQGAQPARA
jgi:hypothetical protein